MGLELPPPINKSEYWIDPAYLLLVESDPVANAVGLLNALPSNTAIVVLHDNDFDGYCANALFHKYLKEYTATSSTSHAIPHGTVFQETNFEEIAKDADLIVVLDQSCDAAFQQKLKDLGVAVLIFDHHSETVRTNLSVVVHSRKWSTTALVDTLFHYHGDANIHCLLARVVNHYDAWLFGDDAAYDDYVRYITAAIFLEKTSEFNWAFFVTTTHYEMMSGMLNEVADRGKLIFDYQKSVAKRVVSSNTMTMKHIDPATGNSTVFGLAFHNDTPDVLGETALQLRPELDFMAIAYLKPKLSDGRCIKLSFRSNDSRKSTLPFSTALGGGGHRNSSGAEITLLQFTQFLSQLEQLPWQKEQPQLP